MKQGVVHKVLGRRSTRCQGPQGHHLKVKQGVKARSSTETGESQGVGVGKR